MLYEVWKEDIDGHQELVDTTASKEEAYKLAQHSLSEDYPTIIIMQETDGGDAEFVKSFKLD